MPTYPDDLVTTPDGDNRNLGLTKREYFAAQALIGLISFGGVYEDSHESFAKDAVSLADALIKALNQPTQ